MAGKRIKITLKRRESTEKQRITLKGLGLKKLNSSRVLPDTDAVRGMIYKVQHLVCVKDAL